MRKILALTLTVVMVAASMVTVFATEGNDIEDRVHYGVHIDSSMVIYENLETGLYKAEHKEGYEDKVGSIRSFYEVEDFDITIFGESNGYIDITERDKTVVTENMFLTKINEVEEDIKSTVGEGVYIVGKDLAVGTYKIKATGDLNGLVIVKDNLNFDTYNEIKDIEIVEAGETIEFEVKEGDFAVQLHFVEMTRVK